MSPTVRVSERVMSAIESFQDEDQSMSDAIEEMADELGLFDDRPLIELRRRLSTKYGLDEDEINRILTALRIVYTKRENLTIKAGVPEESVAELESEVAILTRLGLTELDTTGDLNGCHLTNDGRFIASTVTTQYINEHEADLRDMLQRYQPLPIAFYLEFGFESADSGHLSTARNVLEVSDWIADSEINDEYTAFRTELFDTGFAVRNEWREDRPMRQRDTPIYVLPPKFKSALARLTTEMESALTAMEVYRVVNDVIRDERYTQTRRQMIDTLSIAEEPDLETYINQLHEKGLTSKYSRQETPFFVMDPPEFREYLQTHVMKAIER